MYPVFHFSVSPIKMTAPHKYLAGFKRCTSEVNDFLKGSVDGFGSDLKTGLLDHLSSCLQRSNETASTVTTPCSSSLSDASVTSSIDIHSTNSDFMRATSFDNSTRCAMDSPECNPAVVSLRFVPTILPDGSVAYFLSGPFPDVLKNRPFSREEMSIAAAQTSSHVKHGISLIGSTEKIVYERLNQKQVLDSKSSLRMVGRVESCFGRHQMHGVLTKNNQLKSTENGETHTLKDQLETSDYYSDTSFVKFGGEGNSSTNETCELESCVVSKSQPSRQAPETTWRPW